MRSVTWFKKYSLSHAYNRRAVRRLMRSHQCRAVRKSPKGCLSCARKTESQMHNNVKWNNIVVIYSSEVVPLFLFRNIGCVWKCNSVDCSAVPRVLCRQQCVRWRLHSSHFCCHQQDCTQIQCELLKCQVWLLLLRMQIRLHLASKVLRRQILAADGNAVSLFPTIHWSLCQGVVSAVLVHCEQEVNIMHLIPL